MQNQNSNRYQDKNVSNKYVFVKIGTTDRSNLVVSTLEYAKRFISDKQEDKQSHYHHELYTDNLGICNPSSILPLPHNEGFPFQINSYDDVDEPIFNPEIHLQLEMPEYVRVLPDFEEMKTTPVINCEQNGSRFAYSAPFQVFSEEGLKVIMEIIKREEKRGILDVRARGNKIALRGLYYWSPWIRDLQACSKLREMFCQIAGEELVPHPSFSNSPQVNLSVHGAKGPVDIWHYDSIAYTGVVLLNKVDEMEGGKLEIMHHNKHHALELLANSHDYKCEAISYEKAGKMILAQGSEILHHVTPVLNDSKRISLVFGYGPANSFQPTKTILKTMQRVDLVHKLANFEYFREKAWQGRHCLDYYVNNLSYTSNGKLLGKKLQVVAQELSRAAAILQDEEDDSITIFDEIKKNLEKNKIVN